MKAHRAPRRVRSPRPRGAQFAALLGALSLASCGDGEGGGAEDRRGEDGPLRYVDVTADSGIDFRHVHGGSGEMHFIETNGSGAAFFDMDGDGDQDLYIVQAGALPGYAGPEPSGNALYRNDGGVRFTDVTAAAKVGDRGYGMGALAGDWDGDGHRDLFVYNWGANVDYRNKGDGSFEDRTDALGLADSGYGGTACAADFDRDGDLDLYLGNYVEYWLEHPTVCARPPAPRSYCHPDTYDAQGDRLYRNERGRFTEVSRQVGISRTDGKALGSLTVDEDLDGDPDLFVANDSSKNHLYRNDSRDHQLAFVDISEQSSISYNRDGSTQGSMGASAGDIDGDGDFDLVVTNFTVEANALYVRQPDGVYEDEAYPRGIGKVSYLDFGWGIRFFDHDHDADQDLLVINGHLHDKVHVYDSAQSYAQPARLFANDGAGHFTERKTDAGPFFEQPMVGRGLAMADLDDDGDLDFAVNMNDHEVRLAECVGRSENGWIGLRLEGRAGNPDAAGALVRIEAGGVEQMQEVRAGSSFASQHDPRLIFGLGPHRRADKVTVRWPEGETTVHEDLAGGKYHALRPDAP